MATSRSRSPRQQFLSMWHAFDGLAADTLWSGIHDFLALVTTLTSFELVHRFLPRPEYGAYVGLYGLLGAVGALSYSGVGLAALQRLVGERDDPDRTLRSFLSLAVLAGGGMAIIAGTLGLAFIRLSTMSVILIVTAELLGTATIFVSSMLVQAASGFAAATRVRLGVVLLRLVTVVTLRATNRLTVANLGGTLVVCFALYAIYVLCYHLPRHGYRVSFGPPGRMALKSSGLFSVPMAAGKIQTDADKFFLNVYNFRDDAALYGAAYRVIQLGTMPLMALDAAAFQRFLPRGEQGRQVHWRRARKLATLMGVSSTLVALVLLALLPHLHFLVAADYQTSFSIVPWLLPLVPLISTSNSPLNGLLGLGLSDKRMYVTLSSAAVSLTAYLTLIPAYSWKGAVVASYISEAYLAIAGWGALWYYQAKADAELAARQSVVTTPSA